MSQNGATTRESGHAECVTPLLYPHHKNTPVIFVSTTVRHIGQQSPTSSEQSRHRHMCLQGSSSTDLS
jgi:hypothetical protein